jgi:hypothetical protein
MSDVRESVQKRVSQIRAKLRRLDEAFLHESSIDRTTYEEHRDRLREELTLAELELSDARVEQFDIDSALAEAISVLNNASALWLDASLEDRPRLQEVFFPQGLVWDGAGFQTPVTCLSSITWPQSRAQDAHRIRLMEFKPHQSPWLPTSWAANRGLK